jgi:hypothetical protein
VSDGDILLSTKANKLIYRYGKGVLNTREASFAAVERQSVMAARLLGLLAFLTENSSHTSLRTVQPIIHDEILDFVTVSRWVSA